MRARVMSVPSPALIESDPPPLNPTTFPYAVDEFDAHWLATFGKLIPRRASGDAPSAPENPHRYEH